MLRPLASPHLTPEEKARWRRKLTDPLTIAFAVCLMVIAVTGSLWGMALYRIQRDLAILRINVEAHERERSVKDAGIRQELDEIYRTLYSQPTEQTQGPRRPSVVEQWSINRDAELRKRLQALEQWRYKQDR